MDVAVGDQRYASSIFNLAYRLTRERMESENITQETFLRIIIARQRIRLDEPIKPYVFRVALNLCRDLARKRHPVLFTDLTRVEPDLADEESVADDAPEPWEKLAHAELRRRLNDSVKQLPAHYQTVIILRYMKNYLTRILPKPSTCP